MTGPQLFRRFALLPPFLLMGGCSTLDDFLAGLRKPSAEAAVPLRERPLQAPISANHFVLDSVEQTVIGEPQVVFTRSSRLGS